MVESQINGYSAQLVIHVNPHSTRLVIVSHQGLGTNQCVHQFL